MSFADPISTPKAYERWLKILVVLTILCAIGTVISLYLLITGSGDLVFTMLLFLSTLMFFFAHKEKSAGPRPGTPEYKAIERQKEAKIAAAKDRRYRKQHPFSVARELVENNKATTRDSYKDSKNQK